MWHIQINNSKDYIDLIHCQENLKEEQFLSYSKNSSYFVNCVLTDEAETDIENLVCPKCNDPLPEVFKIQIKLLL